MSENKYSLKSLTFREKAIKSKKGLFTLDDIVKIIDYSGERLNFEVLRNICTDEEEFEVVFGASVKIRQADFEKIKNKDKKLIDDLTSDVYGRISLLISNIFMISSNSPLITPPVPINAKVE